MDIEIKVIDTQWGYDVEIPEINKTIYIRIVYIDRKHRLGKVMANIYKPYLHTYALLDFKNSDTAIEKSMEILRAYYKNEDFDMIIELEKLKYNLT